MFCPTCGRDNSGERKFCVSCGTNLEVVSQALTGIKTNWFTRVDTDIDQTIAKYAEHVFKSAPATVSDRRVSNSWKVLGQGVLTSFVDLFFSALMWIAFAVRFSILLLSTPFRLLFERINRQKRMAEFEEQTTPKRPTPLPQELLSGTVVSVSEHTTEKLREYRQPRLGRGSKRD